MHRMPFFHAPKQKNPGASGSGNDKQKRGSGENSAMIHFLAFADFDAVF